MIPEDDYLGRALNSNFSELYSANILIRNRLTAIEDIYGKGAHFYLDKVNGDDENDGTTWALAVKTPQAAIDLTTDYNGDVIHATRGSLHVTTPLLFNKVGISLIADWGLAGHHNGEGFMITTDDVYTDAPAGIITQPCRIVGMGFSADWAGHGALVSDDTNGGFEGGWYQIIGCRFPNWNEVKDSYAIEIIGGEGMIIEDCDFDGSLNGAYGNVNRRFAAGVLVSQAGHNAGLQVRNNLFKNCTYMIEHAANGANGFEYRGNRVVGAGKGIKFGAATPQIGLVADNYFGTATDATTYDDTIVNLKALGVTFSGNHYTE